MYVKYFWTFLINLITIGWNEYCSDCECLDPNATGPTPAPCDDMWKAKKCKKMKKKGKCGKPKVEKNCKKTCEIC